MTGIAERADFWGRHLAVHRTVDNTGQWGVLFTVSTASGVSSVWLTKSDADDLLAEIYVGIRAVDLDAGVAS